jgi:hypothetical protein
MEDNFDPEILRPAKYICEPDPRQRHFVVLSPDINDFRPITLNDYYESASKIDLNATVPKEIVIQFETAKNLYLYAWFIYRFYPVAEHHAFACLELALRMRYGNEIPAHYFQQPRKSQTNKLGKPKLKQPKPRKPTLMPLLRYAIDKGGIKNEGFRRWHEAVEQRAHVRYEREKDEEMREKGLSEIVLNYSEVQIADIDRNLDYVKILLETLPETRNLYAHGTPMLHNTVLGTIELVSEIINQIYPVQSI